MQKMADKNRLLLNENISKLLMKQSLPAIVAMLVMSLYNVVDTIFIGQGVGTMALAGVTISMPIIMIFSAVSQALGIGFSSIISRALGAKNYNKVHHALGNFLSLSVIFSLVFTVITLVFLRSLLPLLGASEQVLDYAFEYAQIVVLGSSFFVLFTGSNSIIRSIGEAKPAMKMMLVSSIINIVLDAVFIFVFEMGLSGAAWATVVSWFVGMLIAFYYIVGPKSHFKLKKSDFKFRTSIVKEGTFLGFSSFARQASSSFEMIILNKGLSIYGSDILIAGFGIIMRLTMFVIMPIVGIIQGMQPIAGANYGAKKYERVVSLIRLAIKNASLLSCLSFLVIMIFPRQLIQIFTSDLELINTTIPAIRFFALGFPLIGFQVVVGGFYQAIGAAKKAFWITTLRQTLLLIPLLIIVPMFLGLKGLYLSFPIADYLSIIITFIVFKKSYLELKTQKDSI